MTFPKGSSGTDCIRAWDTMPWVLQSSATQEQGEWLQNHLAYCESCSTEFAQQSRLKHALSLPVDISVDANAGLKRLLGRLDTAGAQDESFRRRSGSWLSRALVAAVLIQAVGIGTLAMKLRSTGNSPQYRTLSQEPLPAPPGAIRIVPDAAMTLASWNALLHTLRLEVVGGPNEVGAYTVAPMGSASTTHTLKQLRATQGIRLAEPVAATP